MALSIPAKFLLAGRMLLLVFACMTWQGLLAQPVQSQATDIKSLQVNVNEADAATIADLLVGIGASRAKAIVQYREEHGRFKTLDDLTQVTGVGEATVMNNRDRITFEK